MKVFTASQDVVEREIELARQGECRHKIINGQSFRKTFFHPFCNFMTTALGTVAMQDR